MGLFDRIFGKNDAVPVQQKTEYQALTAYSPRFTSYDGRIYESELVRAAINARATNISKLGIEFNGHGAEALKKRLEKPNAFQSWPQFFYRTSTCLDVDNTCFIVPVFDKYNRIVEIYPVVPSRAKMVGDSNDPWVAFEFRDGKYTQLPVWKVGTLTKFQYQNDFFGESNSALFPTMGLIDITNQGISEGTKSAATFRFMAQLNNFSKADDLKKEQSRYNNTLLREADGGILLFPNTYSNIQQINSKPYVVDADQMQLIRANVYEYFGVNEDVLQNKAYGDAWSAFYEGAIEPFAIQFGSVMTSLFRLCGELSGDAEVFISSNRLQYMSNADKLNVSAQMADRGLMSRDEIREIWNLPPLPDGMGKTFPLRGEYYNLGQKKEEKKEEENGTDE